MDEHLFHVIKGGKSGYINNKGQVIIDFEFDGASSFSEGLAIIFVGDKVGFIDTKGNIKVPPQFDSALGFSEGLAAVTIAGKQGYINTNGEVVIIPVFYQANDFENGLARVMEDAFSKGLFIDRRCEIILKGKNFLVSNYAEGLINCSENENWGFIDITGQFVIPPTYKYTREFSEGKAAVSPKKDSSGKQNSKGLFGFINHQNEMVIPPIFQGSDIRFSEGLCAVWDKGYGYINETGSLIIGYDFDLGEHFHEGLAVFKPKGRNKKYGFIDKTGKVVIKPIFTTADNFENGLASVIVGGLLCYLSYQ